LDIHLLSPESSLISCNILPGISVHNGVLLEVEWDEICREPKYERIVPVYQKTNVSGLQAFLQPVGWKWQLLGGHMEKL
jgi:hypothetical protein